MIRRVTLLVCVNVAVLAATAAVAQSRPDLPSISTSGSAEVRVVPDQIEIAVGVETVNAELASAKAINDAAVTRVIAVAKEHGVNSSKIQTDFINIEPIYHDEPADKPLRYAVRKSVVIVSEDLAGFESLLSALLDAGANHVHSIRFMTSQLRAHRDEARRMATRAALEKARLLAESLGRKVGKVRTINESSDFWGSSYGSWWGGRWGGAYQNVSQNAASFGSAPQDGSLAPGRISVTASVSVTFDLE